MLEQIICDKFLVQPKNFNEGFNCILGDDCASNSIGKSSFLMIIDFIFGGNDYLELDKDIVNEIGNHSFKFSFNFDGERLFFIRDTENPKVVRECDKNYNVVNNMTLDDYLDILKSKYNMPNDISIRNSCGRYARVFPKENCNIKRPLSYVAKETDEKAVLSLLRLFDSYKEIVEILKELNDLKNNYNSIKNAQKYNLVPSINATTFKKNNVQIQELLQKVQIAKETILSKSLDIEALLTSEMLMLRKKKTQIVTRITYLKSQLDRIIQDNLKTKSTDIISYDEIVQFFPDVNIEKIKELDKFHFAIQEIVSSEVKTLKKSLDDEIKRLTNRLATIEERSKTIYAADNDTQCALDTLNNLTESINRLKSENEFYEKRIHAKQKYDEKHELYIQKQNEQLTNGEKQINDYLIVLNDYIYNGERISPELHLSEKKYEYEIDNDHGTGIAYKNVVILDLSILNLTSLPCLIHDSVLLKQIEDVAMEKIAELYASSKKQIFIAFDKLSSYTAKTQKIFNDSCVLRLSKETPLFGIIWGQNKESN